MRSSNIIIKPIVSEKSLSEAKIGRYTFIVDKFSTKDQIKGAAEKLFKVKVTGVFTNIIKGSKTKVTRFGKKTFDSSYKKARVTLEKGQKIDIFEEKSGDK